MSLPTHENGPVSGSLNGANPRDYNTNDRPVGGPLADDSIGPDALSASDVRRRLEGYVARGWYVFPCHSIILGKCSCGKGDDCSSRGKHPRTARGVKDATNDLERLVAWASAYPDANWALACGRQSGVFVVDVDPRHGGFESMDDWESVNPLPETLTALTGGGGRHHFFRYPEVGHIGNRTNWRPGVDVKSDGGYVILEGSTHHSGGVYQWRDDSIAPAIAPLELTQSISTQSNERERLDSNNVLRKGVSAGERDNTIFRACCRWLREFGHHEDRGIAATTAEAEQMAANCSPPFPLGLIPEKVNSALRYVRTEELQRHTDDGNAILYVELHGHDVRFAVDAKQWYAWDGQRWQASADTLIEDRARQTTRALADLARDITDDQQRVTALRHATSSGSANRIAAIPKLARSDSRIGVRTREFDADPYLLNTPTGILDLRTGVETPHRRDAYLSKQTRVGSNSGGAAPEWKEFVSWAMGGDPAMVEFLQRSVGYALFGETQENVLFLLHGGGANGKTTFLNVWERILGDYALHAEADLLTPTQGASTTGQADLFGKRFVVASETKAGKTLDERTVKQLTGGDTITARRLYRDNFSFTPSHTIFFAMNDLPTISDSSYGMWRRVLLVPWEQRVEPGKQDKDKAQRIVDREGPGVLAWAVEGFQKWHRDSDLAVPDAVRVATDSYRTEEDSLGLFIAENIEIGGADDFANVASVSARYALWCAEQGLSEKDRIAPRKVLSAVAERLHAVEVLKMISGDRSKKIVGYRVTSRGTQFG